MLPFRRVRPVTRRRPRPRPAVRVGPGHRLLVGCQRRRCLAHAEGARHPEGRKLLIHAAAQAMKARTWTQDEREQRRQRSLTLGLARHLWARGYHGRWWTPDEVALLGTAPHAVTAAQIPPCGSRGSACSKPDRFPGFPRAGLKKLAGPAGGRPGPSVGTSPPPAGRTSRVAGSGRRRLRRVCFVPEALLSLPCFPLRFPPCLFSTVGRENRSASWRSRRTTPDSL